MKKYFLFLLLFASASVVAQNSLIGVWRASCPAGYKDHTKRCDLCPAHMDSSGKNLIVEDFDFIVEQGGLTITKDNVSYGMLDYTWDNKKHVLSFSFRDKKYNFTAYYNNSILDNSDDIFLQNNDDGTLVLLKKKNVEVIH